ncbi:hypothetical protein TUBRATIS_26630 [Tubulinosema ratisbonensis]|uniref:Uncharacterized protein n=1 Tax=Tubulinosema ratisbonensis TaxID=291195 RepID=A0A437AIL5_9MICR|nr:hypothetical protein TUBRATIS_26630 [Tubulinosema ratisbonensis]
MDFKKTGMFIVGLVASSILLLFCFLKYKNREKAITSPAPKVDYKFSDENRNLVPFFHLIKDYEKEIENSKTSMRDDLLNIISYVKGHITNGQEVEKSLNEVKKMLTTADSSNLDFCEFDLFFKLLLKSMICGEQTENISHQKMEEKNTLDLFNKFGFCFRELNGNDTKYFFCLNILDNNYRVRFKKGENVIDVILRKLKNYDCKNYPQNIFLTLEVIFANWSFEGFEPDSYKNFPDLEIYFNDCFVFYQPSEFIFFIYDKNEKIFCFKSKEDNEFYDSNGIIKKFDSNKKLTPFAIKYSKKS